MTSEWRFVFLCSAVSWVTALQDLTYRPLHFQEDRSLVEAAPLQGDFQTRPKTPTCLASLADTADWLRFQDTSLALSLRLPPHTAEIPLKEWAEVWLKHPDHQKHWRVDSVGSIYVLTRPAADRSLRRGLPTCVDRSGGYRALIRYRYETHNAQALVATAFVDFGTTHVWKVWAGGMDLSTFLTIVRTMRPIE